MTIRLMEPLNGFRKMEDLMNLFERGYMNTRVDRLSQYQWNIPVDVTTKGDDFTISAALPGVSPEDLEVSLDERLLTIKGKTQSEDEEVNYFKRERRIGSFERTLRLPESLDLDKATTTYAHGVLSISIPRMEAKKPKLLTVNSTS